MKIITSIAAVAALTAGSLAYAGPAAACGGEKGKAKAARLMEMDVDKDGKLTKVELSRGLYAKIDARVAELDANKDGAIDEKERAAAPQRHEGKRKHHMKKADGNGDGRLETIEMRAAADKRVAKMMERLDANGDGVLDASELDRGKRGKHG